MTSPNYVNQGLTRLDPHTFENIRYQIRRGNDAIAWGLCQGHFDTPEDVWDAAVVANIYGDEEVTE